MLARIRIWQSASKCGVASQAKVRARCAEVQVCSIIMKCMNHDKHRLCWICFAETPGIVHIV